VIFVLLFELLDRLRLLDLGNLLKLQANDRRISFFLAQFMIYLNLEFICYLLIQESLSLPLSDLFMFLHH